MTKQKINQVILYFALGSMVRNKNLRRFINRVKILKLLLSFDWWKKKKGLCGYLQSNTILKFFFRACMPWYLNIYIRACMHTLIKEPLNSCHYFFIYFTLSKIHVGYPFIHYMSSNIHVVRLQFIFLLPLHTIIIIMFL